MNGDNNPDKRQQKPFRFLTQRSTYNPVTINKNAAGLPFSLLNGKWRGGSYNGTSGGCDGGGNSSSSYTYRTNFPNNVGEAESGEGTSPALHFSSTTTVIRPSSSSGVSGHSETDPSSLSSSNNLSEWQRSALTRMQERARQLVEERQALSEIQTKVQELEAKLTTAKQSKGRLGAMHSRQQLERFTVLHEYHSTLRKVKRQKQQSQNLASDISRLERELQQEEERQEQIMVFGRKRKGTRESSLASNDKPGSEGSNINKNEIVNDDSDCPFLDHLCRRRSFVDALTLRIQARQLARQKRQNRLDWLDRRLQDIENVQKSHEQAELERLQNQEQMVQQESGVLIRHTIPVLSDRVRKVLIQRGEARKAWQNAQTEHDKAQAILEEAERQYVEHTKK